MRIESSLGLFIRINAKLSKMHKDMTQAKDVVDRASSSQDPDAYYFNDSLGRSLHNIYCGIEAILEDVAGDIDRSKPNGRSYHSDLLDQMSSASDARPAVINDTPELRDLMGFRHVFRKLYGDPLRGDELRRKLKNVVECIIPDLMNSLDQLKIYLEADIADPFIENTDTRKSQGAKRDDPEPH